MSRRLRGLALFGSGLLTLLFAAAPSSAEWIPLGPEMTDLRVLESSPERVLIEVTVAGVERATHTIGGQVQAAYAVPGATAWMVAGDPQLPLLRQSIYLPDLGAYEARVVDSEFITLWTEPILPSKGHLPRTVDPASVPLTWSAAYQRDEMFPATSTELHEPYILRDFRGAVLEVRPFRYNAVRGALEVTSRMTIELVPTGAAGANEIARTVQPTAVDAEFYNIYRTHFENWPSERYTPIDEPGRMLIVSHASLMSAAQTLRTWKQEKGFKAELVDMAEIGVTDDQLKLYIQEMYDSPAGLTYVLLVGDAQQIPYPLGATDNQGLYAPSDPTYSLLAGADSYPDAFVSRITAQTLAQADNQVSKFLRYEKNPDSSAPASNWYTKALGIGSDDSGSTPYTDCQRLEFIEDYLLNSTYTSHQKVCDPGATAASVTTAVNDGRSVINYIGHGSGTSWTTTGFNNTNVHALSNGHKQPFILDVSCSNGAFNMNESFAEAWLRTGSVATPSGAIGMYSSSLVCSWVPPCQMQLEAIRVLTEEESSTLGGICFAGIMEALDLNPGPVGLLLFEEYNIFGDCSLQLRTAVPSVLPALVHDSAIVSGSTEFSVTVPGVAGALCALFADGVSYGSAYTDESGLAVIALDPAPQVGVVLTLTVTGFNQMTTQTPIEVINPSLASIALQSFSSVDFGDGGTNGKLEAGESIELTLTAENVGIETAMSLIGTLSTTSELASVTTAVRTFGNVDPAATAQNAEPFVVQISPDAADGEIIEFVVSFQAVGGAWGGLLSLDIDAPVVTVFNVTLDDSQAANPNGVLDPGETVSFSVELVNGGEGDASNLVATLSERLLPVSVPQNQATIGYLASTQNGALAPAFQVATTQIVQPGQVIEFTLAMIDGNGVTQESGFQIYVGGTTDVGNGGLALVEGLAAPSPNPIARQTQVAFALTREQPISLGVYDARGRLVRSLAEGARPAGQHVIAWEGRDGSGHSLPSGVYFVRLVTATGEFSRSVTLVR